MVAGSKPEDGEHSARFQETAADGRVVVADGSDDLVTDEQGRTNAQTGQEYDRVDEQSIASLQEPARLDRIQYDDEPLGRYDDRDPGTREQEPVVQGWTVETVPDLGRPQEGRQDADQAQQHVGHRERDHAGQCRPLQRFVQAGSSSSGRAPKEAYAEEHQVQRVSDDSETERRRDSVILDDGSKRLKTGRRRSTGYDRPTRSEQRVAARSCSVQPSVDHLRHVRVEHDVDESLSIAGFHFRSFALFGFVSSAIRLTHAVQPPHRLSQLKDHHATSRRRSCN